MNKLLFDTDVLIDILRGKEDVIKRIRELILQNLLFCSCITVAEIYAGMHKNEEIMTQKLLEPIIKLAVTEEVAKLAGGLKYRTKNQTLWLDDCLIAATAIINGAVLVTKNVKHYPFNELTIKKI